MSGTNDVVIAGGVQNMNQIPISAAMTSAKQFGFEDPFSGSHGWVARYGDEPVDQFYGAELIAKRWGLTRLEMEEFALVPRARPARDRQRVLHQEIAPIEVDGTVVATDEPPRRGTTLEKMAGLRVLGGGRHDGPPPSRRRSPTRRRAAHRLRARTAAARPHAASARIHHLSSAAPPRSRCCPRLSRRPSTRWRRPALTIDDIDTVEINEAFAPVVLSWMKDIKADHAEVNSDGARHRPGHPLGATGAP
ncbi:thiolase family protein [Yinghuangia aomiensis]